MFILYIHTYIHTESLDYLGGAMKRVVFSLRQIDLGR